MASLYEIIEKAKSRKQQQENRQKEKEKRLESIRKKAANRLTIKTEDDVNFINDWFNGVEAVGNNVSKYYSAEGYKAPNNSFDADIQNYLKNAGAVKSFISANKDSFDNYEELVQAHDSTVKYLTDLKTGIKSNNEFFAEFKDANDFDFWNARNTPEKRLQLYEDNSKKIADLESEKEAMGFVFPWLDSDWKRKTEIDDEIERLQTENANYERGNYNENGRFYGVKNADEQYAVKLRDDFAVTSAYRDYEIPKIEEYIAAQTPGYLNQNAWYWENGVLYNDKGEPQETDEFGNWIDPRNKDWVVKDKLGLFLSATEDQRYKAAAGDWGQNNVQSIFLSGIERDWKYLTPEEIGMYYAYLYESQEKAYQFLDAMELELNRRRTADQIGKWEQEYGEANLLGKVAMNLETIPAKFASTIGGTVNNIVNTVQGKDINPYSTAHTGMHYTQTVRNETAEELDNSKLGFTIPVIDFSLGDIYQAGMSRLDSALATKVFGGGGTAFLGMGAAQEEAYRLYQQGASDEQITIGALAAGAAEAFWEYVSFGKLKEIEGKDIDTIFKWAKSVLVQGANEMGEEAATEVSNIIANALVMGSQSDLAKLYQENEADAFRTFTDLLQQTAGAAFGGFIGGVGAGIAPSTRAYIQNTAHQRNAGRAITAADGGVDSLKAIGENVAGNLSGRQQRAIMRQIGNVSGETATGKGVGKIGAAIKNYNNAAKVGRLYSTVVSANKIANADLNKADVTKSLQRKGFDESAANDIAGAIVAQYNGQELTKAQQRILKTVEENPNVQKVVSDIIRNESSTVGQRQKNIRDFQESIKNGVVAKSLGLTTAEYTQILKEAQAPGVEDTNTTAGIQNTQATEDTGIEDVSGKAFVKSTGEVAQSVSVSGISGNNVTVSVNGNTNVSLEDVSFGNEAISYAYNRVTKATDMTTEAANMILQNSKATDAEFIKEALRAYTGGVRNDQNVLRLLDSEIISAKEANALFEEGRKAASEHTSAKTTAVENKKNAVAEETSEVKKKGSVFYGYEGKTIDQRNDGKHKPLTKKQQVAVNFVKRLAKKFGSTFYFYESYQDENGKLVYKSQDGSIKDAKKGFYDPKDGSIHIDLNGDHVLYTVAHELVHFIKDWSPKQFQNMSDLVMEGFNRQGLTAEELIEEKQAEYAEDGITLAEDEAFEEVIAAALEGIVADGRVMEFLQAAEAKDKSLGAKVKKFFQDIGKLIRDTIDSYKDANPDSAEGRLIRQLEDVYSKLQEAFAEGVYDAGKNFQKAENTTGEGGVRYSIKKTSTMSYLEQVDLIERGKMNGSNSLYIGNPSVPLQSSGFSNNPFVMNQADYRKSRRVSAKNKKYSSHAVPYEFFKRMQYFLANAAILFDNGVKVTVVTSYKMKDTKGNASFVIAGVLRDQTMESDKVNLVKSAYPLDDIVDRLTKAAEEGILVITNKNKAEEMLATIGIQPAEVSHILNLAKVSLSQAETVVKQISTTDSDGNQLTAGQQTYFGKSQERDSDGDLRVMYRGDSEEVMVYDRKKSKPSNLYGRGFYYTSEKSHAGQYGIVRAFYLNTVDPLMPGQHKITKDQMLRFLEAIENDGEDYDLYNYGEGAAAESVLESVWGKGDVEMLQDVSVSAIGDLVAAVELFNEINGTTYDSIRLPTETVIFNSNQAKLTTNKNPTDDPDIRYSVGAKTDKAAQKMLEKENVKLREDVANLRELLKLQGKQTHGSKFTPSSVEAAARYLKKNAGAKGDTKALAKALAAFYEYIATNKDLTWESVREQAKPIAEWLMDHREHTRTEYAQEVLDQIRGSRVYLDKSQIEEAAHRFESYDAFRKSLMGSITIAKDANMSLDSWWQEMSSLYPDVFDASVTASDMPSELADAVDRLRNENSSALEYEHNRRWIEQDLIRDVYDSYWRVNNLRTVADRNAAQINRLTQSHLQQMTKLKSENRQKIEQLKEQHRSEVEMIRSAYRQKIETERKEMIDMYQESRARAVEGRHKTEIRKKIRKVIRDLDKILNRGDKKRNVKEDMKDFVAEALSAAEVLFTDNYTNEDIIRNGFGVELSKEESKYLDEARGFMEELSNLPTGGYDAWHARQEAEEKLKSKLAYRMSKLKDAFFRERQRLNKTEVAEVLGNLADAYAKLETSEYAYVNGAYHEAVYQYLKMLQEEVGGAKVKDMTLGQLQNLHKAYTMVLTTVQNANKMFAEDLKQSKEELANRVMMEVHQAGGEHGLWSKGQLARNQASWNNTKPIYAAERTGSATFVKLFNGLFKGQYNWATDMEEAKAFRQEVAKKYGFKSWDMEKTYKFTSSSGINFELNLNQIMALYAYAKREQAHDHLLKGGFVFGKNTEVVVTKNGIKRTYLNKSAKAHNISDEIMGEIVSKLSKEQKGFVDEMQDYLSTTMGNKGNEVSMRLYGVKLFVEKFYFPLRSAGQFKEKAKEAEMKQQQGQISIANSGFTNAVTPKASNPVVLDGFTDVWASHVNEMSLYHSMVLPMEDFRRVYNYASPNIEGKESASVNSFIENAYGDAATGYFDQLYKELNGGAIVDPRENLYKQMIGKFKKSAVMLSNSVWVQQFSAIGRAYALIDAKYFIGPKIDKQKQSATWNELKQYAPVAIIKEMGGFDTNTGLSAKDYLLAEEYGKGERIKGLIKDEQYRDEIMGLLPAKADELTWCAIWEAVKRETKAKNAKMDVKSEEFLKKAGERFSEIIEKTQVYDSVLARSANMRSKNGLMQMVTAFMAEPTTTVNMVEDALRKGDKKQIARTFGAVAASVILNNALASIVYGMRDDDEDETFLEKYAQAFTSGMLDDINPMTYYPVLKDIWSLFQGYDVERSDVAIYSDIADAVKRVVVNLVKYDGDMDDEEAAEFYKQIGDALMSLLDAGASAFGVPLKNVRRDLMSYYNTVKTFASGNSTTWNSFVDAVGGSALDSIPIVGLVAGESKTDKLYDAIISGDTAYVNRLRNGYVDDNAYRNAVRKALRENDPRIREAAIAWNNNDLAEYMRIAKEVIAEKHFVQDDVVMAIRSEANSLLPDGESTSTYKAKGLFTEEKFAEAVAQGDFSTANAIRKDIIQTSEKNGKSSEEAEKSFNASAKTKLKDQFVAGNISEDKAADALSKYCGLSEADAVADVQYWAFTQEYPDVYVDDQWFDSYYEKVADSGLPIDVYMEYRNTVSTITGDGKKEKRMAVIHALPITKAQKDALYLAEGWAESTLYQAPWH